MRRYVGGISSLLLGFPFIVMHEHVALLLKSMVPFMVLELFLE
jgi:hypothetical protein